MYRRTHFWPEQLYCMLEAVADKQGIPISELLRSIVKGWADKQPSDIRAAATKKVQAIEKAKVK